MKIIVSRTSCPPGPPCKGAVKETLECWDRRTKAAKDLPGGKEEFLSYGRRHELGEHSCRRLVEQEVWTVEADILEFVEKYGQCVVTPPYTAHNRMEPPLWQVEVYDYWRE